MKRLINTLLFVLAVCNPKTINANTLNEIIEGECNTVPQWVIKKVITHESKSFKNGEPQPWPWTLNIDGKGWYYRTYNEALVAATFAFENGAERLGVGFGQIEWKWHSKRFGGSFAKALNPTENIKVVCEILRESWQSKKVNSWEDAIAYYHRPVMDKKARLYAEIVLSL